MLQGSSLCWMSLILNEQDSKMNVTRVAISIISPDGNDGHPGAPGGLTDNGKEPDPVAVTATTNAMIYTDGACLGNPGPGGYAALIIFNGVEQVVTGNDPATTNNRMEMTAAIKALQVVPQGSSVILHSDSQIVIKGMTEWLPDWKAKGWRNAAKKPVANQDLWLELDALNAAPFGHLGMGQGSRRSPQE